jgi:thiol-disulfide isomerase/thioredoxin
MLLLFGDVVIRRNPISLAVIALITIGAGLAGCDREKQADGQASEALTNSSTVQGADNIQQGKLGAYQIVRRHKGEKAPTATFQDKAGGGVTLAEFEGKPLLLNLWATWCAPCVAEMPTLEELATSAKDRMAVIAVSQDLGDSAKVHAWMDGKGLKALHPYTDTDNALLDAYNSALPTTILYDSQGREVWRVIGALDWHGPKAQALLAEAE